MGRLQRPVTPGKVWDGSPLWSPDRRRVAFLRETDTDDESRVADLSSWMPRKAGCTPLTTGDVSPLLLVAEQQAVALEAGGDLFVVKPGGGSARRRRARRQMPAPPGRRRRSRAVFAVLRGGHRALQHQGDPVGRQDEPCPLREFGVVARIGLAWSRDGERIAFSREPRPQVIDRDGIGLLQIIAVSRSGRPGRRTTQGSSSPWVSSRRRRQACRAMRRGSRHSPPRARVRGGSPRP